MVSLGLFWPTPLVMTMLYAAASSPEAAVTKLADFPLTAAVILPTRHNVGPIARDVQAHAAEFRKQAMRDLAFVFLVARPSAQQRHRILEEVERAMPTLFREQDAVRRVGNQIHFVQHNRQKGSLLRSEVFRRIVRYYLADDQWAAVERQLVEQQRFSRNAVVRVFVSKLSELLLLSTAQQEALVARLNDKWDDRWTGAALLWQDAAYEYLPPIPDGLLNDILTDNQKQVWQKCPKFPGEIFWDRGVEIEVPVEIWNFQLLDQFLNSVP